MLTKYQTLLQKYATLQEQQTRQELANSEYKIKVQIMQNQLTLATKKLNDYRNAVVNLPEYIQTNYVLKSTIQNANSLDVTKNPDFQSKCLAYMKSTGSPVGTTSSIPTASGPLTSGPLTSGPLTSGPPNTSFLPIPSTGNITNITPPPPFTSSNQSNPTQTQLQILQSQNSQQQQKISELQSQVTLLQSQITQKTTEYQNKLSQQQQEITQRQQDILQQQQKTSQEQQKTSQQQLKITALQQEIGST